ncbi:hypothetical protein N6H14_08910 [Paenibacillus sp. CC-CFT747]|nr:hypothetical protein N6H14_08910 [Paenibacillus sp. CC-CFT747]
MKSVKATLSLLAIGSTLAVSACSSSSPSSSPSGTSKPDAAASAAPAGPLSKYPSPVEVTTVRSVDASIKFKGNDTIDNNEWTRAYLDELGIKLKYNWIATSGEDATQKMNVMIASGSFRTLYRSVPSS